MCVIRHEDGFAVAELFGDELEMGEVLIHDWDDLGSGYATRENGGRVEVYMQGSWGNLAAARQANGI